MKIFAKSDALGDANEGGECFGRLREKSSSTEFSADDSVELHLNVRSGLDVWRLCGRMNWSNELVE